MKADKLRQSVEAITAHLSGWKVSVGDGPRDNALYLIGPENVMVLASSVWNQNGRIEFSPSLGDLYNFEPYQAPDRPSATVSADRDPKAAARDIKRRCLDPVVPYILTLREKKAQSDAVNTARLQSLQGLADACGGKVAGPYNHPVDNPMEASAVRGEYGMPSIKAGLTYGKMLDLDTHTYGPDRVKMEIDYLDMEDALALLRWLRFRLWPENGQQGHLL